MFCFWEKREDGLFVCPECKTVRAKPPVRRCKPDPHPWVEQIPSDKKVEYLGTKMEKLFKRWGITEERLKEVFKQFGRPPSCKCQARRDYLNKVDKYLRDKYGEFLKNKG